MKQSLVKILGFLVLSIFVVPGCQKDIKESQPVVHEDNVQARAGHDWDREKCRLVSSISEFGEQTYTYNQRGMVAQENVDFFPDGKIVMEYSFKGRLKKSRVYSGDVILWTIVFFYWGDRLVKETWYDGDTETKTDEVFHFYNRLGRVWKSQSFMGDYVSLYDYTPDGGSVDGWKFFIGGKLNYEQVFTYLPPHQKMPDLARPGLVYDFISPNGWWGQGRWYSTSEKDISYDENGENPVVLLDQDPTKTIREANCRNYVTVSDFYDVLTQEYVHFRFTYENCCDGSGSKPSAGQEILPAKDHWFNPIKLLRSRPGKSIKEKMKVLRSQFNNKIIK